MENNSVGTEKDGIYIYDPDDFKECIHIKYYAPLQSQLKNDMLLTMWNEELAVIKLTKDNYEIKMIIDCDARILYIEALDSNHVAAIFKYRENIYIYQLDDDFKNYSKKSIYVNSQASCKFILKVNNEEILYIISPDTYSAVKQTIFYNYIKDRFVKSLNIYVNIETKPISKISKNLIAAASETRITLIDIK